MGRSELEALLPQGSEAHMSAITAKSSVIGSAISDFAMGEILSRSQLGRIERQLVVLGMLISSGASGETIKFHAIGALRVGADQEEILAIAEISCVYSGIPNSLAALDSVHAAITDVDLPALPKESIVSIAGHETCLYDTGKEGEPILLLHALGCDHRMWRDMILTSNDTRRIIAYDLRGFGRAAGAPDPITLEGWADDAAKLMDHLGISKVHMAGLSIGGTISQLFAIKYPEKLHSLSLICTVGKPQPAFKLRAEAGRTDGMDAQIVPTLSRWFTADALAANTHAVRYARSRVTRCLEEDWVRAWNALADVKTFDRLKEISVPTKVIAGALDPSATPALMKEIADEIPGSEFITIEGGPHMLSLEKPKELAEILFR